MDTKYTLLLHYMTRKIGNGFHIYFGTFSEVKEKMKNDLKSVIPKDKIDAFMSYYKSPKDMFDSSRDFHDANDANGILKFISSSIIETDIYSYSRKGRNELFIRFMLDPYGQFLAFKDDYTINHELKMHMDNIIKSNSEEDYINAINYLEEEYLYRD
ncbi:MAG: hypothetical protein K5765_06015 [Clostridia bacterium]|nr:hypothetical protein [Clostridia bacterium]